MADRAGERPAKAPSPALGVRFLMAPRSGEPSPRLRVLNTKAHRALPTGPELACVRSVSASTVRCGQDRRESVRAMLRQGNRGWAYATSAIESASSQFLALLSSPRSAPFFLENWLRVFRRAAAARMGAGKGDRGRRRRCGQKNAGQVVAPCRPGMRLSAMVCGPHAPDGQIA